MRCLVVVGRWVPTTRPSQPIPCAALPARAAFDRHLEAFLDAVRELLRLQQIRCARCFTLGQTRGRNDGKTEAHQEQRRSHAGDSAGAVPLLRQRELEQRRVERLPPARDFRQRCRHDLAAEPSYQHAVLAARESVDAMLVEVARKSTVACIFEAVSPWA